MRRPLRSALSAMVLTMVAGPAAANLIPSNFDIFASLTGAGANTGAPLTAELGITIDSNTQTTWTLLNTTDSSSGPGSGGQGVGDPPRIDELFFNLEDFPPFDASDLLFAVISGPTGWSLTNGGSSGGGGTFALSAEADNASNLGVDQQLVFTLSTSAFIWSTDTFLNAADSTNGQNPTGFQVAASFQTVGDSGEDSGVATGRYTLGGTPPAGIPEPNVLLLMGTGLLSLAYASRRRTRK